MHEDGEIYEPKLGLLVATNPLQSSNGEHKEMGVHPKNSVLDAPASQTLAGAGLWDGESTCPSQMVNVKGLDAGRQVAKANAEDYVGSNPTHPTNIREAPDNSEFKSNPRLKDVVEFIRRHPRTLDDVSTEFGLSREYTFNALNELKNKKKIWFNKSTLCFEFGLDKNPVPVVADKEFEVM